MDGGRGRGHGLHTVIVRQLTECPREDAARGTGVNQTGAISASTRFEFLFRSSLTLFVCQLVPLAATNLETLYLRACKISTRTIVICSHDRDLFSLAISSYPTNLEVEISDSIAGISIIILPPCYRKIRLCLADYISKSTSVRRLRFKSSES